MNQITESPLSYPCGREMSRTRARICFPKNRRSIWNVEVKRSFYLILSELVVQPLYLRTTRAKEEMSACSWVYPVKRTRKKRLSLSHQKVALSLVKLGNDSSTFHLSSKTRKGHDRNARACARATWRSPRSNSPWLYSPGFSP